jgi:predicted membrane-bound spermidine synthase
MDRESHGSVRSERGSSEGRSSTKTLSAGVLLPGVVGSAIAIRSDLAFPNLSKISSKELDPRITKLVDENFWELF